MLLLGVVLTVGCFRYTGVQPVSLPANGQQVRVELTSDGFGRLVAALGPDFPHSGRHVEGELVEADAAQLLVAIRVWSDGAGPANQLQQRVSIPVRDVVELQVKALDTQRTALVAVGAAAVLGSVVAHHLRGTFGGTTTGTGTSAPTERRVPGM